MSAFVNKVKGIHEKWINCTNALKSKNLKSGIKIKVFVSLRISNTQKQGYYKIEMYYS